MTSEMIAPLIGLNTDLPENLYILKHEPSGTYGCLMKTFDKYPHLITGLVCFNTYELAESYSASYNDSMTIIKVVFDEAREVAKSRPPEIVCMMIFNSPNYKEEPIIHYVR
jgi:hypothetical protein